MAEPFFVVDSFTDQPFRGNPAAVVLLDSADTRDDPWMQAVAREFNLSETAFVYPRNGDQFRLRWFTPAFEVDLCGHATVAAAKVLWHTGAVAADHAITFTTRSGHLAADQADSGLSTSAIELDFPVTAVTPIDVPSSLQNCFSYAGRPVNWKFVGKSAFDLLLQCES